MHKAVTEVKALNALGQKDEHATVVTFDGTRLKHGFISFYDVLTCIDWNEGLVLDLYVSTKYCQSCKRWRERGEHDKISAEVYHACP